MFVLSLKKESGVKTLSGTHLSQIYESTPLGSRSRTIVHYNNKDGVRVTGGQHAYRPPNISVSLAYMQDIHIPKTLVISACPYHIPLVIWVRVRIRVTGDADH